MTPERDLHYTLIKYFDMEGESELANIIKRSKIVYDKGWTFTGIVSDQRRMTINIKTPYEFKKILETQISKIKEVCFEIYEDDDKYRADDVRITTLAGKVTSIEINEIEREIVQESIYNNFIMEVSKSNIDIIEKKYLFEACECATRNNRLAASTMLGCAAEYLLIKLCEAYYSYLQNNGTRGEYEGFERKVLKAKCAYDRLDEFEKRVESNSDLFVEFGFENPKLNFNFLDIIRKVRNQSGHPTGNEISEGDLKMIFGNYQHFIKLAHDLIDKLPSYTE
ncbi:hypothetical protein [Clostridium botulinum]|uniref:hypothetical protein n=1 Tax=Clostridium botulinum TaxID=1491 RepID=UPI000773BCC9|nr:hypothetical protein [Clostridium botulinum]MBY6951048.1 hypothetical protein [Clostridium botulinum]MCR1140290.1 hypothetical protein [Clostridium botulinum]NEZ79949.1 hypothetical protein [Clostridium botulinum]NFA17964.1 hypothetical protein [Clostridium botulinum]NFA54519.1 hypothetical protein [Clostridium botulinum]